MPADHNPTSPIPSSLIAGAQQPLSENAAAVYISGLASDRSRYVMLHSLDVIAALLTKGRVDAFGLAWGALRYQHTAALRGLLLEQYSPASVNRMLSALRGTLKAAWRLGQISTDDYQRAVDIQNVREESLPGGRDLGEGEIIALIDICRGDESPAGPRDIAILAVLYACGLRREELTLLNIEDFERETGTLRVLGGKGRKQRLVYLQGGALRALLAWLHLRGTEAGPLFVPVLKNGRIRIRRMTAQAIYYMLKKRGAQSGVKSFSPHDLRRSFVSDLLDKGADIATVAKLAGHSDLKTTARYDRRPEKTKRQAAQLLDFPF